MVKIAICNAKGGSGKSATSISLAAYLASRGKKTLLVDANPQANSTRLLLSLDFMEVAPEPTLYDVLYSFLERKKNIINEAIRPVEHHKNLFLLSSSLMIERMKTAVTIHSRRPIEVFKSLFKPLEGKFDYLIFDCPADLSIYVENALEVADYVLCTSTYARQSVEGVAQAIPLVWEIKGEDFAGIKVLMTKVKASATVIQRKLGEYIGELEEARYMLDIIIPEEQAVENADMDNAVIMLNPAYKRSKARKAYEELGAWVIKNWT